MARSSRDLSVGMPAIFSRVCVCLSASEGWRSRSVEKGGWESVVQRLREGMWTIRAESDV
jgi:hypothetical protein